MSSWIRNHEITVLQAILIAMVASPALCSAAAIVSILQGELGRGVAGLCLLPAFFVAWAWAEHRANGPWGSLHDGELRGWCMLSFLGGLPLGAAWEGAVWLFGRMLA